MSTVLDEIIVGVREDLAARVQQVPLEEMKKRASQPHPPATRSPPYAVKYPAAATARRHALSPR